MLCSALKDNFGRIKESIADNILVATEAMIKCGSSNTSAITRSLCVLNKKSFKTNNVWLYRLLEHKDFQVDDTLWRCHAKTIFQILAEQGEISRRGDKILINVDFTSDCDDFLILCASVILGDTAVPLYFSMRNYPKRKNQCDQKKMECAFIKALRHIVSDKYAYVIVADRGFGNDRFIQLCIENGFDVLIRIEPNMTIETGGKTGIIQDVLTQDGVYACRMQSWQKDYTLIRHSKDEKVWYLLSNISNINGLDASHAYARRFRIEKLFQGLKSSGFDIERSKIKKYDRFKRLLFLSCLAQSLLVLIGKFVNEKCPTLKKTHPSVSLF